MGHPRAARAGGKATAAVVLSSLALASTLAAPPKPGPPRAGAAVWKADCAPCHGADGEGAAGYPRPLTGTRSVGELARVVGRTMPPGPRRLPAVEARAVAAHLHAAFYSPVARERARPARAVLSRLTARQFRLAVSDLIAAYRPGPTAAPGAGLRAEYHKARRLNAQERLVDRVDPEVRFDFGKDVPVPAKGFDPYQFSVRWSGSIHPPDSGAYEMVVHTDQSFRLWVNNLEEPLIDRSVKSGTDTAFRASIVLEGGRAYPIKLEFTKSTQGVDDTKTQEKRPVAPAFVRLAWRRPKLDEEIVPARFLSPAPVRPRHMVATPLPPDDRSRGYERGDAVSAAWDEAVTEAALDASAAVVRHLRELSGVPGDAPDRRARLMAWCEGFVERAFRAPLDPETRRLAVGRFFEGIPDTDKAVRTCVLFALKSPRFLYLPDPVAGDAWSRAARLSFALWDTLPDDP
ncbi:MAG: PA14 domain-containing protein, partial [Armatimonadota bacterium]